MATDIHIHALPRRLADITMIYPEGVLLYDQPSSTIYIGDGRTAGGIPLGEKAYRLWLVDNPNGTVEDYLASLNGADGTNFAVDAAGVLADLIIYNAEPKGFSYLATDTGNIYIKEDDLSGAWSAGIPFRGEQGEQGDKGDKGDIGPAGADGIDGTSFEVTETGLLAGLSEHDTEFKGFSYLATDTGDLYIKQSNTSGDWSNPIPFQGPEGPEGPEGPKGDQGAQGEQGPEGPSGADGNDGNSFTYDDFTTEQLDLLVGPQGPKGDQGDTGAISAVVSATQPPSPAEGMFWIVEE